MLLRVPNISRPRRAWFVAAFVLCTSSPSWADFEVKAPDGRTILVKDDGTWQALNTAGKPLPDTSAPPVQAELRLTRGPEVPGGCSFSMTLINHLPYEIRSLVPDFVVYRSSGVAYSTQSVFFGAIKSGDQRQRDVRFDGITCADIAKLQVQRADRCEMGELNKFSDSEGQCLARVRLQPSDLVKFEK